jgi:predicted MPP superfamily phosphohydrolase
LNKKFLVLFIIIVLIGFLFYQNNSIEKTFIEYTNERVPEAFNGFKIIHISDLHNKSFGKNQEKLIKKIREEAPDIIVITGDLVDRRKYDLEIALSFIEGTVDLTPVYYVSGNHEAWSGQYEVIKNKLVSLNVQVLDDEKISINKENSFIDLIGLKDPDFNTSSYLEGNDTLALEKNLRDLSNEDNFQILLSHRPELFNLYAEEKIDLIFSGHAHGGQFRLPFIGGVIAPDQGVFPEYTSGLYAKDKSTLIVSRGLGNSIIPIRFFNQPEIIVLTINN